MIRAATVSHAHRVARRVAMKGSRRPITSGLTAVENKVKEGQAKQMMGGICQGAENPTYLKQGSADIAMNAFGGALVFFGLGQVTYGFYNLANGTNQLD